MTKIRKPWMISATIYMRNNSVVKGAFLGFFDGKVLTRTQTVQMFLKHLDERKYLVLLMGMIASDDIKQNVSYTAENWENEAVMAKTEDIVSIAYEMLRQEGSIDTTV